MIVLTTFSSTFMACLILLIFFLVQQGVHVYLTFIITSTIQETRFLSEVGDNKTELKLTYSLNWQIWLQAVPVWPLHRQSLRGRAIPTPCHCLHLASVPSVLSLQTKSKITITSRKWRPSNTTLKTDVIMLIDKTISSIVWKYIQSSKISKWYNC